MPQPQAERRRYPRVRAGFPVALTDSSGLELLTKTIDLSDGGALIPVPFSGAPAVGQEIDIKLTLPVMIAGYQRERVVACRAFVVRHQDLGLTSQIGIGIEFATPQKLDLLG
ncbi:MAG: PilZ domain-containing protein [Phycisphaerae bacterium]